VAAIYFDSSALVKLLVEEGGTEEAAGLWDACDVAMSSRLAYPEVCAALAAANRNHTLTEPDLRRAQRSWKGYWATAYPVELNQDVQEHAGTLASRHALRGADAVHLASALAVADSDFHVAVWDKRLRAGATAEGLIVTPASI
jgi:predicted nucleic acid-binding protein